MFQGQRQVTIPFDRIVETSWTQDGCIQGKRSIQHIASKQDSGIMELRAVRHDHDVHYGIASRIVLAAIRGKSAGASSQVLISDQEPGESRISLSHNERADLCILSAKKLGLALESLA